MDLIINTDGGARGNPGPAAIGVFVVANEAVVYESALYLGTKTNNEAEYLAILHALEWLQTFCQTHEISSVAFKLDSQLVVNQLQRNWKIKEDRLRELAQHCWQIMNSLSVAFTISYVPRAQNVQADRLVNQALDAA